MSNLFIFDGLMPVSYTPEKIKAVNAINKEALLFLESKDMNALLGNGWCPIIFNDGAAYLGSSELGLLCCIKVNSPDFDGDEKHIDFFLINNTSSQGKNLSSFSSAEWGEFFRYKEANLTIPFEPVVDNDERLGAMPRADIEQEVKTKHPSIEIEKLQTMDLAILHQLAKITINIGDEQFGTPQKKCFALRMMLGMFSTMFNLPSPPASLHTLRAKNSERLQNRDYARNFSLVFDYLINNLEKLGINSNNSCLNYNDGDDKAYLTQYQGRPALCTLSQNGGWLTVKGEFDNSWACYNLIPPFKNPKNFALLPSSIVEPALEIENNQFKYFDCYTNYCQYAVWGASQEIQKELIERGFMHESQLLEPEELVKNLLEEVEIKKEKSKLEGLLPPSAQLSSSKPTNVKKV